MIPLNVFFTFSSSEYFQMYLKETLVYSVVHSAHIYRTRAVILLKINNKTITIGAQ